MIHRYLNAKFGEHRPSKSAAYIQCAALMRDAVKRGFTPTLARLLPDPYGVAIIDVRKKFPYVRAVYQYTISDDYTGFELRTDIKWQGDE